MNLEKEKYEKPEMEVIEFESEDIVTVSNNTDLKQPGADEGGSEDNLD